MPKKILVADDENAKRTAVAEALKQAEFEVTEAGNGQIALDKALSEHPDLILLDINMPVMSGLEMLRQLRQDDWGKDAEVLLFTSYANPENASEALKLGAHNFLVKQSFDLDEVVEAVKRQVGLT